MDMEILRADNAHRIVIQQHIGTVRVDRVHIDIQGSVHVVRRGYSGEHITTLLSRVYRTVAQLREQRNFQGWVAVTLIDSKARAREQDVLQSLFQTARCGEAWGADTPEEEERRMAALLKLSAIYCQPGHRGEH